MKNKINIITLQEELSKVRKEKEKLLEDIRDELFFSGYHDTVGQLADSIREILRKYEGTK